LKKGTALKASMARGIHGLPKVAPGLAMPDPVTLPRPAGGLPLKRSHGRFRVGSPARQAACGRLLPVWIPHTVRACFPIFRSHAKSHGVTESHANSYGVMYTPQKI
jgi:hypothetical protein